RRRQSGSHRRESSAVDGCGPQVPAATQLGPCLFCRCQGGHTVSSVHQWTVDARWRGAAQGGAVRRYCACQTSSGLRVAISSADLRWTSASRSRFFGNRLRLAWIIVLDAWASCQRRTARSAASHPFWNSGATSESDTRLLLLNLHHRSFLSASG